MSSEVAEGRGTHTAGGDERADGSLAGAWTFWAMVRRSGSTRAAQAANYEGGLRQLSAPISTAEDFWAVYCRIARASCARRESSGAQDASFALPLNTDIQFFRAGVKPVWEDPANAHGGRWAIRVKKALTARLWEQLLLALSAGLLENMGVCGAVLSIRYNEDVISLWTAGTLADAQPATDASGRASAINLRLRDRLRTVLSLPHHVFIEYKPHDTAMRNDRPRNA